MSDNPVAVIREDRELLDQRKQEIDDDYDLSRKTYRDLVSINKQMLLQLRALCEESEHPRAFEVFSTMSKQTAEVADKLMDLHRKKQVVDVETDLQEMRDNEGENMLLEAKVVEDVEFTGSPADLQRHLEAEEQESLNNSEEVEENSNEEEDDDNGTEPVQSESVQG